MTTVYKKVRVDEETGRLYSAFVSGELSVTYKPSEWVKPDVGKLFAFGSERSAKEWSLGSQLWKAEAEDVKRLRSPLFIDRLNEIQEFAKCFWARQYKPIRKASFGIGNKPPVGTIICSRMKLLERIG